MSSGTIQSIIKGRVSQFASSETQGLLAGTMHYFRASERYYRRKFTLSAEEPLGTYSYRTSSRSGLIPFR